MSTVIEGAVKTLSEKLADGFDGSVKFIIEGEGPITIDSAGVRAADDPADCTVSADTDTFLALLTGELDPTAAFMSGKLSIDGDMGAAMKLGALLG